MVEAVAELLEDPPGEVVACGLDHQGESVLAWDAESGEPLTPIVVWQDKRSQEVLDRLARNARRRSSERSGLPFDPYFSAAKLAWLLEHDEAVQHARARPARCAWARSTRSCATGSARGSPPTPRPRRARSCTRSARPASTRGCASASGCRPRCCPRSATRSASWAPCATESGRVELPLRGQLVDQQAALAGAGCVVPGRVKATYGTGVFVLAHVGDEVPDGRRAACCRPWRGASAGAWSTRSTAACSPPGAMLEWLCRELGVAPDPPALGALAREAEDSAGARCCPRWPGIGAPWWRPEARAVIAGLHGGTTARERRPRGAGGDRLAGGGHRRRGQGERGGAQPCGWTAA